MKRVLFLFSFILASVFFISAQTYDEWIDKSFKYIESKDWAEEINPIRMQNQ